GLVGNHSEPLALGSCQFLYSLQRKREGLDGTDDNLLRTGERLCQLSALACTLAFNSGHHSGGALKIKDGLLQLLVNDVAVRDDQHGVKDFLLLHIVQICEEVC